MARLPDAGSWVSSRQPTVISAMLAEAVTQSAAASATEQVDQAIHAFGLDA